MNNSLRIGELRRELETIKLERKQYDGRDDWEAVKKLLELNRNLSRITNELLARERYKEEKKYEIDSTKQKSEYDERLKAREGAHKQAEAKINNLIENLADIQKEIDRKYEEKLTSESARRAAGNKEIQSAEDKCKYAIRVYNSEEMQKFCRWWAIPEVLTKKGISMDLCYDLYDSACSYIQYIKKGQSKKAEQCKKSMIETEEERLKKEIGEVDKKKPKKRKVKRSTYSKVKRYSSKGVLEQLREKAKSLKTKAKFKVDEIVKSKLRSVVKRLNKSIDVSLNKIKSDENDKNDENDNIIEVQK